MHRQPRNSNQSQVFSWRSETMTLVSYNISFSQMQIFQLFM